LGNIEWQNTIGGAGNDDLYSLAQTTEGGYILGGRSNFPISGDKTEASDEYFDYWIVKIDSIGVVEWENTLGGNEYDYLYTTLAPDEGGCFIGGMSNSTISADKSSNGFSGSGDYWVLKLDSLGNIEWQNTFGGTSTEYLYSSDQTLDGGVILGGFSDSDISGNKNEINFGIHDYWVVKIDSDGEMQWQKTIGGSYNDLLRSIKQINTGAYILGGYSFSDISGIKADPNIGFEDYWILELDTLGNILWQKTIGGWLGDFLKGIDQTTDNGYILAGYSSSPVLGDKTEESLGANDYWVIKLSGDCINSTFYKDNDLDSYGNNSDSILACISPIGYISNYSDCNDLIAIINPGAIETCNGLDDNCNFVIDEGLPIFTYYLDADLHGYGNPSTGTSTCLIEIGEFVFDSTDCDDTNPTIYPGAEEILNGLDDNCNDSIDEGLVAIENINSSIFQIYPNLNTGNFQVILQDANSEEVNVSVFNLTGETLYSKQFNSANAIQIELPESFSGFAIIQIKIENKFIYGLIIANCFFFTKKN